VAATLVATPQPAGVARTSGQRWLIDRQWFIDQQGFSEQK
jgi:hypothetical protein